MSHTKLTLKELRRIIITEVKRVKKAGRKTHIREAVDKRIQSSFIQLYTRLEDHGRGNVTLSNADIESIINDLYALGADQDAVDEMLERTLDWRTATDRDRRTRYDPNDSDDEKRENLENIELEESFFNHALEIAAESLGLAGQY